MKYLLDAIEGHDLEVDSDRVRTKDGGRRFFADGVVVRTCLNRGRSGLPRCRAAYPPVSVSCSTSIGWIVPWPEFEVGTDPKSNASRSRIVDMV